MSDITVTFGGREVVLRKWANRYEARISGDAGLIEVFPRDDKSICFFRCDRVDLTGDGSTPQAAVSAVEAKLRELVRSINDVLGE
jgi:hypothetical protein